MQDAADPPDVTARIAHLEGQVADQAFKLDKILDVLQNSNPSTAPAPVPTPGQSRSSSPSPATPASNSGPLRRPKAKVPNDYDGDRKKGRVFLYQVKQYVSLRADEFMQADGLNMDEEAMIRFALSYMVLDKASSFSTRVGHLEESTGRFPYTTWAEFEKEFSERFIPENEASTALLTLETDSWHQGKKDIYVYMDAFQELVDFSGLTDPLAIVMKFRRGLENSIQTAIAESRDCPGDRDLDGWKRAASRVYNNRAANKLFSPSQPPRQQGRGFSLFKPAAVSSPATAAASRPFVAPIRSAPISSLPAPVPMEVDAERLRGRLPMTCYRCGGSGHMARNCPNPKDIRLVDAPIEQLELALQEHYLQMDIASLDDRGVAEQARAGGAAERVEGDSQGFAESDE